MLGRLRIIGFDHPPVAPDMIAEVPAKVRTNESAKSGEPLCPIRFFISALVSIRILPEDS